MAQTIFIKFCGFIVHSSPNNMALSDFPEKIIVPRKMFNFLSVAYRSAYTYRPILFKLDI